MAIEQHVEVLENVFSIDDLFVVVDVPYAENNKQYVTIDPLLGDDKFRLLCQFLETEGQNPIAAQLELKKILDNQGVQGTTKPCENNLAVGLQSKRDGSQDLSSYNLNSLRIFWPLNKIRNLARRYDSLDAISKRHYTIVGDTVADKLNLEASPDTLNDEQ